MPKFPPTRAPLPADDPFALRGRLVVWLLAATLVAAVLRLWQLGEWSLWIDEAHTWRDATMPIDRFLTELRATYPLTFLLLRGLFALGLGQDEASLRMPFVVIGIATVPLMAVCGRRLVGAQAAVISAWLLALNPWHVFWSQNARGYVVVVLAAVVAADRARAYVRSERVVDALLLWGTVLLGALSHTTGALVFAGFVLFLMLRSMRSLDRSAVLRLTALALFLLFGLPWLIEWSGLFDDFLRSKSSASLLHFVQTMAYYFRPPVLLAAALGVWLLRPVLGRDRTLLLTSLVVMPILVLLAIGGQLAKATARYAICTLPMILWLGSFAVVRLSQLWPEADGRLRRLAVAAVLPVVLLGDYLLQLRDYHGEQHGQRAQWRQAAELLRRQAGARPLRVLTTSHPILLYYLRPGHWAGQVPTPDGANRVVALTDWMLAKGLDESEARVCDPGTENHFRWHSEQAGKSGALLAVAVTQPELAEVDHSQLLVARGEHSPIRAVLARDFELLAHLPCWVGPKDESIYLYVPRMR